MSTVLICLCITAALVLYASIALAIYRALKRYAPDGSEAAERALAVLWPVSVVVTFAVCIARLMEMLFDLIGGGEK